MRATSIRSGYAGAGERLQPPGKANPRLGFRLRCDIAAARAKRNGSRRIRTQQRGRGEDAGLKTRLAEAALQRASDKRSRPPSRSSICGNPGLGGKEICERVLASYGQRMGEGRNAPFLRPGDVTAPPAATWSLSSFFTWKHHGTN